MIRRRNLQLNPLLAALFKLLRDSAFDSRDIPRTQLIQHLQSGFAEVTLGPSEVRGITSEERLLEHRVDEHVPIPDRLRIFGIVVIGHKIPRAAHGKNEGLHGDRKLENRQGLSSFNVFPELGFHDAFSFVRWPSWAAQSNRPRLIGR